MILVYICPHCDSVRIVSRRKEVFCLDCGKKMNLSDLSFLEWSEMTEESRQKFAENWNRKKRKK